MYLEDSKSLGQELESDFTRNAKESGLSEDETKNAFNQNVSNTQKPALRGQMIPTGMVSKDLPAFTREVGKGRKWLIGDYQAGDAVFHHSCKLSPG